MQPNFPHEHTQTSCSNIFKYKRDENHKKVEADCDGEVICISTNTQFMIYPIPKPFSVTGFLEKSERGVILEYGGKQLKTV